MRNKTVTVKYNGANVRLNVNKSGVLYMPNSGRDAAGFTVVGFTKPDGSIEIDGAILAACMPVSRAKPQPIRDINTLVEALRDYRDTIGNKGGALYGVISIAAESLELGAKGGGWIGNENAAHFLDALQRGFYIAVSFDNRVPLSGRRHTRVSDATSEIIRAACKAKKPGMKFAVLRVLPMLSWKFDRNGSVTKSSWVCAFAVSTLRENRAKRDLKHGVGSCTVSASKDGSTHPIRVVKYRRR